MLKGINKVMRAYIYWNLILNSAWGLLGPVFAIFLLQNIALGNVAEGARVAGFATLFYWIVKSALQIPIGRYLDKNYGEIDDFWFFVIGTMITGLIPLGYIFSYLPWHIYTLNIVYGIGMSMVIPSSYAIFIRHIDQGREAYEIGLDSTLLGIGVGVTGAIGGIMAGYIGFKLIFLLTGLFTLVSVYFIFRVKKDMLPKVPGHLYEVPLSKAP
jgi:hypothetical protein